MHYKAGQKTKRKGSNPYGKLQLNCSLKQIYLVLIALSSEFLTINFVLFEFDNMHVVYLSPNLLDDHGTCRYD
jgi:hypothetical protein